MAVADRECAEATIILARAREQLALLLPDRPPHLTSRPVYADAPHKT